MVMWVDLAAADSGHEEPEAPEVIREVRFPGEQTHVVTYAATDQERARQGLMSPSLVSSARPREAQAAAALQEAAPAIQCVRGN